MNSHIKGPISSSSHGAIIGQRIFEIGPNQLSGEELLLLSIDATPSKPVYLEIIPVVEVAVSTDTSSGSVLLKVGTTVGGTEIVNRDVSSIGLKQSVIIIFRERVKIYAELAIENGDGVPEGVIHVITRIAGFGQGVGITAAPV